jgi:glycosyltransferase involved in cell wall biosynthesis
VRHGCYRGSRLQTLVWADATARQRARGIWRERVDRFLVPGSFAARKLVASGLPAERVRVKPNPVADPGEPRPGGRGALYVGRLSPEKGVALLLEAWREMPDTPLTVVGGGPEAAELRSLAAGLPQVRFTGELSGEGVQAEMARAAFLVAPSIAYENFPLVVAEAFAAGRPVVASDRTALGEMVEHGRTGLLFRCGEVRALAAACRRLAGDAALVEMMGREARQDYEDQLTPEHAVERLVQVYREVIGEC